MHGLQLNPHHWLSVFLSQDFLFAYIARVQAVNAEDVLSAAQRHLHPGDQTLVVAADAAAVQQGLEAAGFQVQPLELDLN